MEQLETARKAERQLQSQLEQTKKTLQETEKEAKAERNLFLQKAVQIAEVFEKKQIDGSKYSLDILCDFVFDKAKKQALKVTKY